MPNKNTFIKYTTKGEEKGYHYTSNPGTDNWKDINSMAKTALFLEAFRNLNWSRGYSWYCELDGVPNPFNRGGVIGLPATAINFKLTDGKTFEWNSSTETLSAPLGRNLCSISLSFIDDEHETMFKFFERWYNNIYNTNVGVLPLTEACKCLSVYKLKSTRTKIKRNISRYELGDNVGQRSLKECYSRDFLVFPVRQLYEDEKIDGAPRSYTVELNIASQENADFGNPAIRNGTTVLNVKGHTLINNSDNSLGASFLTKLSNYI